MCDACVTQVGLLPIGIEAAALELPELKGGVERSGLHFNRDGVDDHRHSLNDLLGKSIFTLESRNRPHTCIKQALMNNSNGLLNLIHKN